MKSIEQQYQQEINEERMTATNAVDALAKLLETLDEERRQHAACLSIAEGRPGWDVGAWGDSEAMIAVRKLRTECDHWRTGYRAAVEHIREQATLAPGENMNDMPRLLWKIQDYCDRVLDQEFGR